MRSPFFYFMCMAKNAALLVTSALLGYDEKAVSVAGNVYVIKAPTIRVIAKAAHHLCQSVGDGQKLKEVLSDMAQLDNVAKALSVFIAGDESKTEELLEGTFEEMVHALDVCYSMMSIENFCKLSALRKSVARMIANPRL